MFVISVVVFIIVVLVVFFINLVCFLGMFKNMYRFNFEKIFSINKNYI